MAAPYRLQNDVLAHYPLRTCRLYVLEIGIAVLAVTLVGTRVAAFWDRPVAWLLLVVAALLPLGFVRTLPHYRVAGGAGEIRLFRDRVEVPHPSSREPIRMALPEIRVRVLGRALWVNGVQVRENHALVLSAPGIERVLASETFASPEELERVASDIRRLQWGLEIEPCA